MCRILTCTVNSNNVLKMVSVHVSLLCVFQVREDHQDLQEQVSNGPSYSWSNGCVEC